MFVPTAHNKVQLPSFSTYKTLYNIGQKKNNIERENKGKVFRAESAISADCYWRGKYVNLLAEKKCPGMEHDLVREHLLLFISLKKCFISYKIKSKQYFLKELSKNDRL